MTLAAPPYGRDLSATDSIDSSRIVSGSTLLAQAMYRRLVTPRSALEYAPNYGLGIQRLLSSDMSADRVAALPAFVRAELLKDPRVDDVQIVATVDRSAAPSLAVRLDIAGRGKDGTAFELVALASELGVELISGGSNG